ncbi:MAG: hypothetical protein AAGF23_15275 [Acidobacteriota bacterium]
MTPTAPDMAGAWRRRAVAAVALALVAATFLFHALRLDDYGRLQRDDYYGLLFRLGDGVDFHDTLASFWNARINQHRVTIPAIVWRGNVALADGDNRPTAYLALAFLAGLVALGRRFLGALRPGDGWLALAILAWAVAGPQATDNLAKSFGGVHYFLADLLSLGAAAALLLVDSPLRRRVAILALGLLGILTFSSSLAIWPALALGVLWRRRTVMDAAVVAAGAVTSFAIFRHGLGPGGDLPTPTMLIHYVTAFLGGLPRLGVDASQALGAVGLLVLTVGVAGASAKALGRPRTPPVPVDVAFWLMAAAYAAGNAALAGLGRGHAGPEQALAIRYVLFPGLFWAALAVLALRPRLAPRPALARGVAVAALAVPALAGAAGVGLASSGTYTEAGRWQRIIEVQLRHGAWDADLLRFAVTPNPPALVAPKRRAFFESIGHVPWDRPAEDLPDRTLDRNLELRGADEIGELTRIVETAAPQLFRAGGWVAADAGVREVVFTDARGRQRSRAFLWPHPRHPERLEWSSLVLWHPEWKTWTPFAVLADGSFRRLSPKRYLASKWQEWAQSRRPSAPPSPPATPRTPAAPPSTGDSADDAAPPD